MTEEIQGVESSPHLVEPNFPPSKCFSGHTSSLTCVALFPNGKTIISGSYDRRIRLWDVETGQASGEFLRGHKVAVCAVAVSPDGTKFVSGGGDGRILIWNAATRSLATEPIEAYWNRVDCISFSPDSASIASTAGKMIKIWDVETAKLMMEIELQNHAKQVAFSPEGSRIAAVSSYDHTVRILDAKTGALAVSPMAGHSDGLLSVAWFPNGQCLITASRDRTIRLWSSETGCQIGHALGGHPAPTVQVAVSSDGKFIAALGGESIRLWNAITLDPILLVLKHDSPVLCMTISADARFIAGGSGDKRVFLWDIESITRQDCESRPSETLRLESQEYSNPGHTVPQVIPVIASHRLSPLKPSTPKEDAYPAVSRARHGYFRQWWRHLRFLNTRQYSSSARTTASPNPQSNLEGDASSNQGQSPAQDVLDEFNRYVMNDIPIRLIYVPTMELVGRNFVKTHFLHQMKEITEDLIAKEQAEFLPPLARERVVPTLVQSKVKYGILSHRWLDTGEPSYQEMMGKNLHGPSHARHLPGYIKLGRCCKEARRLGLQFLWTDTCCIDKTSSAELDESIRSMFRWYRNSTICIIYLGETLILEDLRRDEWFIRGWTLQELLAPQKIKFFNKEWQPLTDQEDDKEEDTPLMTVLEEVTGISETELQDFSPVPQHIDKRMTWAAQRRTTRAEDVAYSLMGIFDVSLQIAYGEGGERAFGRLIEALMHAGGDSSVLNWAGDPARHHVSRALPASPASYVGHPDIVRIGRLDLALTSRGLRVPLVVLPLEVTRPEFDGHPVVNLKFRCPHHGIGEVNIDSRGYKFNAIPRQYALGVFHYIPAEDSSNPGLPKELTAYLLERTEVEVNDPTLTGLSRHHRSTEDGWRRIPTGFIYFELPEVPDFASLWYVSRTCLETVYL
ncbi:WD40 repeat-like protein [Rhizopogon vinicolor AM-OR11-026]|uniref:WD40 repeat-like protein n=1 Tax=Rhizopogon vinicolor AM-OR11-026 TaxID=1314800 RepID=A0A1B7N068_9AGAM|nr:WD40 repeat-like protein [Rhizopogon vinicolor AM-OR11-026]